MRDVPFLACWRKGKDFRFQAKLEDGSDRCLPSRSLCFWCSLFLCDSEIDVPGRYRGFIKFFPARFVDLSARTGGAAFCVQYPSPFADRL